MLETGSEEEKNGLLEAKCTTSVPPHVRVTSKKHFGLCIAVLALSNIITPIIVYYYARERYSPDFSNQVDSIFGTVDRNFVLTRFSHFNFSSNEFTGPPGNRTEAAWESLGIWQPYFILPKSLGTIFGLNKSHYELSKDVFGQEGYPVVPEMIHQLHCLNSLRMHLYYNNEYYAAQRLHAGREIAEIFMKTHLNHCIDALRQRILCSADLGVVPFLWRNMDGDLLPDFGRKHKCYNHQSMLSWYTNHAIPEDIADVKMKPPPDAVIHPIDTFFR